jgi:hypothetical protein
VFVTKPLLASGAILNNIIRNGLQGKFSDSLISQLTSSAFTLADLDLSDDEKQLISSVYMRGLHAVFMSYAALMILLFLCTLFVYDYGLHGAQKQPKADRVDVGIESPPKAGSVREGSRAKSTIR